MRFDRAGERKLLLLAGIYLGWGWLVLNFDYQHSAPVRALGYLGLSLVTGSFLLSFIWEKRRLYFDCYLLPLTLFLLYSGLIFLFRLQPELALRQCIWALMGLGVLLVMSLKAPLYFHLADYKYVYALSGVILLLLPIFWGVERGGARGWLQFGGWQVQPAELVKILLVLFLASYLADYRQFLSGGSRLVGRFALPSLADIGPLIGMWSIAMLLVVFQRDLGTALIYFATFLAMVYVATARWLYILTGCFLFATGSFISYHLFAHVRVRVATWLDPWQDPTGTGYQIIQSLIAMASGGVVGTGLGFGHPELIPVVQSDFIFAAMVEEMGLAGGLGFIILYLLFVFCGVRIALNSRHDFALLVAAGLTSLFAIQVFIIIAGVSKLLPLTGVTLPFISYGGSSLIANFILLAILLDLSHEAYEPYAC